MYLLFDVLKHAYISDEFKENIGMMLMTITDPRLKEEIYYTLSKLSSTDDLNFNNLYYLSKPYQPTSMNDRGVSESDNTPS